jgi:YidC/Oxa1 family membrane protein insertase
MEEKKLDVNSIIGFVLIFGILIYMFYINQPTPEELAERQKQEQVQSKEEETATDVVSLKDLEPKTQTPVNTGAFKTAEDTMSDYSLENEVLSIKVSQKGGVLSEVKMKSFVRFDSLPVYLIKEGNSIFNVKLIDRDNRIINTKDLVFEAVNTASDSQLTLRSYVTNDQFIEFNYQLNPSEYLFDFSMRTQGLSTVLNTQSNPELEWKQQTIRQSKSVMYENRYTELTYKSEGDKISELSATSDDDEEGIDVDWISYKQHFFNSILIPQNSINKVSFTSENLAKEELDDAVFTKRYGAVYDLNYTAGELNQQMNWYFGPTDIKELAKYKSMDLESSIYFGWGIFGWINRYIITPLYTFLSSFLPFGIAIVVMTILVRLAMSPVTYKSYLSQSKMKVLKPEITEINEKYKDNAMKKQQETMALYSKAGVSPMSGCVPALLQLPIFYALFMFFPSAFVLRQKPFLWATDLSSYDVVAELPFNIPFYGDHVSLFPILASVAIFFYMKMTTGQNMPSQPGMPNMKFILYLSPLMMLFFFNSFASGLSLYYFVSNLITIFIMLVIKNYIIDEDRIHAQIQVNKQKPKKQSKFQQKMKEMMEQAEAQKKNK